MDVQTLACGQLCTVSYTCVIITMISLQARSLDFLKGGYIDV